MAIKNIVIQMIYNSKKDTLESVETKIYIQMHNYVTGVCIKT